MCKYLKVEEFGEKNDAERLKSSKYSINTCVIEYYLTLVHLRRRLTPCTLPYKSPYAIKSHIPSLARTIDLDNFILNK